MDVSFNVQVAPILMQFLTLFKAHILQSGCSHIVRIVEQQTQLSLSVFNHEELDPSESAFAFTQIVGLNSSDNFGSTLTQKFATLCSLTLYDLGDLRGRFPGNESITDWTTLPGSPNYDYHIFVALSAEIQRSELPGVAHFGSKLKNAHFLLLEQEKSIQIWRPSYDGRDLVYRSTYNGADTQPTGSEVLSEIGNVRPNFMQKTLVVNTCAVCGQVPYQAFLGTGVWLNEWDSTTYKLSLFLNASIQYDSIGALPKAQSEDEGEWDEWVDALVDGSAAAAELQPASAARLKAFHYPTFFYHDSVIFVTAKPKRVQGSNKLTRLFSPLGHTIWIAWLASVIAVVIALEIVIHGVRRISLHFIQEGKKPSDTASRPEQFLPRHLHHLSLTEVLRPILSQGGNSPTFEKDTRNNWRARLLLALWFLMLNVLRSGYQDSMVTSIVAPEFTMPPTTFRELANSDYRIYGLFLTGIIEEDFKRSSFDYREKILNVTEELSYFDPDCFVLVQKRKSACITLRAWAIRVGYEYSVNIKGQLLFQESKERIFPKPGCFAVSKHFVSLLDTLEFLIRGIHNGGLIQRYAANLELDNIHDGKQFAQTLKVDVKAYGGKVDETRDSVLPMLFNVLFVGLSVSVATFLYEGVRPRVCFSCRRFSQGLYSRKIGIDDEPIDEHPNDKEDVQIDEESKENEGNETDEGSVDSDCATGAEDSQSDTDEQGRS